MYVCVCVYDIMKQCGFIRIIVVFPFFRYRNMRDYNILGF